MELSVFRDFYKNEGLDQSFWKFEEVINTINSYSGSILYVGADNQLDGFLLFSTCEQESELLYIYVSKLSRGCGVSKELMQSYLNKLVDNNVKRVFLEVRESNELAQNLYKSYDFNFIAKRKKYYKDGESAFIYEKVL